MSAYKEWLAENIDSLSEKWEEYLSYMQDSTEHVRRLSQSDAAFEEFCYDQYVEHVASGPEDEHER